MDSLIVSSLYGYIKNKVAESNGENVVQFRIPSKTYSFGILVDLLNKIELYYEHQELCKCVIKIAKQAIDHWNKVLLPVEMKELNNILDFHPSWIDDKGNLTSYRNEISTNSTKDNTLLILVGYDLIDDQASLSHFLDCGEDILWEVILRKDFKPWIKEVCNQYSLSISNLEEDKCNCLLLAVYRYSDLQRIDFFLREIAADSDCLSESIGNNLDKIGLQIIDASNAKNVKNCNLIISRAKNYFDRNIALEGNARQPIKKIDELIEQVKEDEDFDKPKLKFLRKKEHYEKFVTAIEYLETCKKIVEGIANDEEKKKFIKSDSATFIYDILGYKPTIKGKDTVKIVNGLPFTAVLHALWITISDYMYQSKGDASDHRIKDILIEPIEFYHNFAVANDEDLVDNEAVINELIIPYLGGIDKLISDTIENTIEIGNILENATIKSNLCPMEVGSKFTGSTPYSAVKTPAMTFSITITGFECSSVVNKFKLVFKKNCAINYTRKLIAKEYHRLKTTTDNYFIPVFTLGKYGEFFTMTDSESDDFFVDLIENPDSGISVTNLVTSIRTNTTLNSEIKTLYFRYKKYIESIMEDGFYHAMTDKVSFDFRSSYQDILSSLTTIDSLSKYETLRVRMLKAFWIIDKDYSSQEALSNKKFKSGCLTVLHPAMVEMLNAQISYLSNYVSESLKEAFRLSDDGLLSEKTWQRIEDFSAVQSPIPCVLDDNTVRTQTKGSGLFFKVGITGADSSDNLPLSVTFDTDIDLEIDDISDSDLTKVSDESNLICNLLSDYIDSYGFASDGLKIAIFMPVNIQAIMSAIIVLVKNKIYPPQKSGEKKYSIYPFKLEIEFYSDPEDEGRIGLWIAKLNNYFAEKTLSDNDFSHVDLSVGYRMIRTGSTNFAKITENIERDFQADVTILYESHDASLWKINEGLQSDLRKISSVDPNAIMRKFPMIEKLFPKRPISEDPTRSSSRMKLISNRQFITYERYLGLMYSIRNSVGITNADTAVVIEQFDFSKWLSLLDWCLSHSERVIAIGGEIDKELVLNTNNIQNKKADLVDIVGFGSGVGANANLNYIVASRIFSQKHSEELLCDVFRKKFSAIDLESCSKIANILYEESKYMADLSLVRTLSCYNYYANNYLGYAMVRHVLHPSDTVFCDVVLSLDSYKHWFNHKDMSRADLLWVIANRVKGLENNKEINIFKLKLTVIESKVATDVEIRHIDKAYLQINATLEELQKKFSPSSNNKSHDARYWWMQLHRIISSNAHIQNDADIGEVLEALEYLAEGKFEVEWDSCIFAFEESIAYAQKPTEIKKILGKYENDIDALIMYSNGIKSVMSKKSDLSFDAFKSSLILGGAQTVRMTDNQLKQMIDEENLEKAKDLKWATISDSNEIEDYVEDEMVDRDNSEEIDDFGSSDLFRYVDDKREEVNEQDQEIGISDERAERERKDSKTWGIIEKSIQEETTPKDGLINSTSVKEVDLILIGKTKRKSEPVYWNIAEDSTLTNRHMLILGASGTGKSYAIKAILGELARKKQSTLILDYTDGFTDGGLDGINSYIADEYYVKKGDRLPIDPFKANEEAFDSEYDIATRVASVFERVYSDIGNNQKSVLADTIENGLKNNPGNYTMDMLLDDLTDSIGNETGSKRTTLVTLETKIKPFCKTRPFKLPDKDYSAWQDIFFGHNDEKQITIFQLKNIALDIKTAIADFVLWDLWYYVTSKNTAVSKLYSVVLDEIQNLNINIPSAPVYKYLSEGRKFGFGVISASQGITGLGGAKGIGVDALMNAGTILIFRPKPTEVEDLAKMLYQNDHSKSREEWSRVLNTLDKGECVYLTNESSSVGGKMAKIIKITSFEERGLKG